MSFIFVLFFFSFVGLFLVFVLVFICFFCFVLVFFNFTSEEYKYLFHSVHLDNPKDKCIVLSLHHSLLHFYRHMREDSLAHKIQGGTLKKIKVSSEDGLWRKTYIP